MCARVCACMCACVCVCVMCDECSEEVKEEDLAIQEPTTQMLENVKKVLTTTTEGCGWCIVGSTAEDWSDVIEELSGTKHQETRRLVNTLKGLVDTQAQLAPHCLTRLPHTV